jgi:hypothetical protein
MGSTERTIDKCLSCGTELLYAIGIGPYCPNHACKRIDWQQPGPRPSINITPPYTTSGFVLDQVEIIRRALERGKRRAEQGCVASESLDVFIHCLDELQRIKDAVDV